MPDGIVFVPKVQRESQVIQPYLEVLHRTAEDA
jgi:hypothetical protein